MDPVLIVCCSSLSRTPSHPHPPFIAHHTSHITHNTSHITHHTSHRWSPTSRRYDASARSAPPNAARCGFRHGFRPPAATRRSTDADANADTRDARRAPRPAHRDGPGGTGAAADDGRRGRRARARAAAGDYPYILQLNFPNLKPTNIRTPNTPHPDHTD